MKMMKSLKALNLLPLNYLKSSTNFKKKNPTSNQKNSTSPNNKSHNSKQKSKTLISHIPILPDKCPFLYHSNSDSPFSKPSYNKPNKSIILTLEWIFAETIFLMMPTKIFDKFLKLTSKYKI
jgi:hypothetical protein